jgi:hypothetical protein
MLNSGGGDQFNFLRHRQEKKRIPFLRGARNRSERKRSPDSAQARNALATAERGEEKTIAGFGGKGKGESTRSRRK